MSKSDLQNSIQWFRDAAPYIHAHRGKTVVLAFDGAALLESTFPSLIEDIALLSSLGLKLVLVHGVRPQTEQALQAAGQQTEIHNGLRITDQAALSIVKQVVGSVRVDIEALLSTNTQNTAMANSALHIASGNYVTAQPVGVVNGIDHLHTGKVRKIHAAAIQQQLNNNNIVLLSPLGYSPTGEVFNLRAEDVAVSAAAALHADKLVFLMESESLQHQDGQRVDQMNAKQAHLLSANSHFDDELITHLRSAITACEQGVARTHLISRQHEGALLQELYTRDGQGCLITNDIYEDTRPAQIDDVCGILDLLKPLEDAGVLVYRSREQLELEIAHFTVVERDGKVIACAALYPYAQEGCAELACIVVSPEYCESGRGNALLHAIETQAQQLNVETLFVLTTQTAHWFIERGFAEASLEQLPEQKRELYNLQRNSKVFCKKL